MTSRDLKKKLRAIRAHERGIRPDSAWLGRTREALLTRVKKDVAMVPVMPWYKAFALAIGFSLPMRATSLLRRPVMGFASIVALLFGGSAMGVHASESSVPGDFLYPMKLAVEQTRLIFTKNKASRLKLKAEYVTRRVKEIKTIAANDVTDPTRPERIKEAAEILKRDLDTVKTQLHEVQSESTPSQAATIAKVVDQASSQVAQELKNVKSNSNVPVDVKITVTEAQAAAVNTGVKAVQVLIESREKPDTQEVLSHDELRLTLQGKVDGLKENLTDVTQKILGVTTSSTNPSTPTSSALSVNYVSSSSLSQIKSAEVALEQTRQLIQENKLDEVKDKLAESAKVVGVVETTAEKLAITNVSSTANGAPAAPTPAVTSTSTASVPSQSTTTQAQ